MKEKELYSFYNESIKPLYCEIEARNNTLPVELLFEIFSAFDHLKRFHLGEDTESNACLKAQSHLKRGALDAFKLKLKFFNSDYENVFKREGLGLIDNGNFLQGMLSDRKEIVEVAKRARLMEGNLDIDKAFENWVLTSDLINKFEDNYFDERKLKWAGKQHFIKNWKDFSFGVLTGVVSSLIVFLIQLFCR